MSERNGAAEGHSDAQSGSPTEGEANIEESTGLLDGIDRRQYMKLGAATAAGAAAFSGTASAQSRGGVSFDRVVDAVDDLGMDPNGNEPIDSKLDRGWSSGTLIEFPAGEYLVTREHGFFGDSNVGMVGKTGDRSDVEFVFPDGYDDRFLTVRHGRNWLFGDFTIQQSGDRVTGVGCAFGVDDNATIRNIEIAGFNPRNRQRGLALVVYDSGGTMDLNGYVRAGRSAVGSYPSGTQALLVPTQHQGTLNVRNARIENAGENGIYASRCPGNVRISNSYFANNDIASVRIAGSGSFVKNSTFVVDTASAGNPGSYDNARGLWVESGSKGYTGGRVVDCDFVLRSAGNSGGLLRVGSSAGDLTVENCRFRNETRYPTLVADPPSRVGGSAPITVRGSSFTSNGADPRQDYGAIGLERRDGSLVSGCCISAGGSQDGVVVRNSGGCTVRRSTIDVGGQAVASPGSNVATAGLSYSGSCPLPSDGGSGAGDVGTPTNSTDGSSDDSGSEDSDSSGSGSTDSDGSSDSDGGSTSDSSSSDSDASTSDDSGSTAGGSSGGTRTLTLTADTVSPYEFTVSGDLEFDPSFGTEDRISGSSASGVLVGGTDKYVFSGDVTSFSISGSPTVRLDGQRVDPASLGGGDGNRGGSSGSSNDGGSSEAASEGDDSGSSGSSDSSDSSDSESTGSDDGGSSEGGSSDASGDSGSSGSSSGGSGEVHALTLRGDDVSPYEFTVSGDVSFDPAFGTEDRISGSTVRGVLAGGTDSYQFSGSITSFDVEGSPTIRLDGQRVDPASLGSGGSGGGSGSSGSSEGGSDDTSSTDGSTDEESTDDSGSSGSDSSGSSGGSEESTDDSTDDSGSADAGSMSNTILLRSDDVSPYELTVSGDIAFDPSFGTEDTVSGDSANGVLAGGADAYRFSGSVTGFEVDGPIDVTLNGESVDPASLGN
jgi:hypothetical protein